MDPHTRESRGFGFVNMVDVSAADKSIESLSGKEISGRVLSVEKARRKRPRTPTPGKYFGPPKVRRGRSRYEDRYRDRRDFRGSRYDERPRYDDPYRRSRYDDRDRDRYYRDRERGGGGGGGDRYRYEERDRYPSREYRDRYERRYSRDERLPPRDDRMLSREDRLPPRDIRDDRPFRDDRDRYSGPPPASDSYRDRDDYH